MATHRIKTTDNEAARQEDQEASERADMMPKGGKGPSAASASPVQGAFGDAEHDERDNPKQDRRILHDGLTEVGGD